jgi:hypothetical protein
VIVKLSLGPLAFGPMERQLCYRHHQIENQEGNRTAQRIGRRTAVLDNDAEGLCLKQAPR